MRPCAGAGSPGGCRNASQATPSAVARATAIAQAELAVKGLVLMAVYAAAGLACGWGMGPAAAVPAGLVGLALVYLLAD